LNFDAGRNDDTGLTALYGLEVAAVEGLLGGIVAVALLVVVGVIFVAEFEDWT